MTDVPSPNRSKPHLSKRMTLSVLLAVLLTLGSGLLHGRMSRLWGVEEKMGQAAELLDGMPHQIGEWQREGSFPLGDSAMELLQCRGYLHHGYRNDRTGRFLRVAVMVGPGSKISVHVPEICFESTNYTLTHKRRRVDFEHEQGTDSFWTVTFQSNDVSERRLNVYYGWKADDGWVAPQMPRWSVAGSPVLYKLQLTEELPATGDASVAGAEEFLKLFLPILNRRLAS